MIDKKEAKRLEEWAEKNCPNFGTCSTCRNYGRCYICDECEAGDSAYVFDAEGCAENHPDVLLELRGYKKYTATVEVTVEKTVEFYAPQTATEDEIADCARNAACPTTKSSENAYSKVTNEEPPNAKVIRFWFTN